jgi:CheY-like chemotaxis protein
MSRAGHILLVEDNEVNQLVAVEMLQRLGYRVDVASSGLDALTAVESHRYDAVLMDCQMPKTDGYQATMQLRRREGSTRHTPVIAMTAYATTDDRERCLAAGMDDHVSTPLRLQVLADTLRRWVPATAHDPMMPRSRPSVS